MKTERVEMNPIEIYNEILLMMMMMTMKML